MVIQGSGSGSRAGSGSGSIPLTSESFTKIFLFIRANELVAEAAAVQAGVPAVADPARRMHGQLVRDQLKDNMPARGGGGRRRWWVSTVRHLLVGISSLATFSNFLTDFKGLFFLNGLQFSFQDPFILIFILKGDKFLFCWFQISKLRHENTVYRYLFSTVPKVSQNVRSS